MSNTIKNGIESMVILLALFAPSCTAFLEGTASAYIPGKWHAISIDDDATSQVSNINTFNSNMILGNKLADGIEFSGSTFSIFRQSSGPTGVISGTFDIDVLTLKLTFAGEPTIRRVLRSISEREMIMRDTIGGIPKTITYSKQ